jgi:hypothetical protein
MPLSGQPDLICAIENGAIVYLIFARTDIYAYEKFLSVIPKFHWYCSRDHDLALFIVPSSVNICIFFMGFVINLKYRES